MDYPVTPAVRVLRERKIDFEPHLYAYEERGGTRRSAESLGVEEHSVVKTLVMETDARKPLIVLMHGDREVSTKQLARQIGARSVEPCKPEAAQRHTGYLVGGTSPFGTRAALPVYVERTIFDLAKIYINGGKRGFLVSLDPKVLRGLLPVEEVSVAVGGAD
jgi:Cys-tRNA(Pro) deacylase